MGDAMIGFISRRQSTLAILITGIALTLFIRAASASDETDAIEAMNRGDALRQQGDLPAALAAFTRALSSAEAAFGKNSLKMSMCLDRMAITSMDLGQYAQAEPLLLRCLAIREQALAALDPSVGQTANNLGGLYFSMGRYSKAELLLLRGLKIAKSNLGPDHPNVGAALGNLALLYRDLGQYAKAEPYFLQSLQIKERTSGPESADVARSLNGLASLYTAMWRYDEAQPLYLRSLKICESKLDANHPLTAQTLSNLGLLYLDNRQFQQAKPLFERSLKIGEQKSGPSSMDVATRLHNLASLDLQLGEFAAAEPLFARSLKIGAEQLGAENPTLAVSHLKIGQLLEASNRTAEAAVSFEQSRRILRQHIANVLPILSEQEQLVFLSNRDYSLANVLSFGFRHGQKDAGIAVRSAGWLANGKGVAQQALAESARLARDATDPQRAEVVLQLNQVRSRLAALTFMPPADGQQAGRKIEIAKLTGQEIELAKQIAIDRGEGTSGEAWVEMHSIRESLPRDGLLVDIFRLDISQPVEPPPAAAKGITAAKQQLLPSGPHYVAWIVPPVDGGDVRVVDLGAAKLLEEKIASFQAAMSAAQTGKLLQQVGEVKAEKFLAAPLAEVSKLVLEPLLPHIKQAQQLVLCPDAGLWLIPWSALPTDDGKYAIERWNIRYLTAAREIVKDRRMASSNPPRIFANPNFDLAAGDVGAALADILGGHVPPAANASSDAATIARGSRSLTASHVGRVPLLPGTAAEALAIAPRLKEFTSQDAKIYAGNAALEGVFKRLNAPRILVLSTHGFFLPDPETTRTQRDVTAEQNPLLRCGLLLAGCNNRDKLANDSALDDGVLTGMEIVGTNLRGTELVVLSACETGIGKLNNGQGVAGLRQAFQLAGAQAVVSTLWQIPDQATALLMNDFFANLAAGQSKSDSLRNAQLARIKARREKYGAAHPLFWAAFTLTGQ